VLFRSQISSSHLTGFISQSKCIDLQLPLLFPNINYPDFYEQLERDLLYLLRLDVVPFWSTCIYNSSIFSHLVAFLKADPPLNQPEISKLELRLLMRVYCAEDEDHGVAIQAAFGREDAVRSWMKAVKGMMNLSLLMDITKKFGDSNQELVRPIFRTSLQYFPEILDGIQNVISTFHALTTLIWKKQSRLSGGGKGKNASPIHADSTVLSESEEKMLNGHIFILLDSLVTISSFVKVAGRGISDLLVGERFMGSVYRCYDIAKNLVTIVALKSSDLQKEYFTLKSKTIKKATLDLFHEIIRNSFLTPLSVADFIMLDGFIEFLHGTLEVCEVEGAAAYLENAPLLVDYDVMYDICGSLKALKHQIVGVVDEEESRIEYLIQSCETLLEYSGNAEVKRVGISLPKRKTRDTERWVQNAGYVEIPNEAPPSYVDMADVYAVRGSVISEVRDLFPHFGEGFIDALLDSCKGSTEAAIDKILMDDFPPDILLLDRELPRKPMRDIGGDDIGMEWDKPNKTGVTTTGLLESRKNVFDNDEFDIFARGRVDESKVILGKKAVTAVPAAEYTPEQRAAILEMQYEVPEEGYDDERDDTYDSQDIVFSGPVDSSIADDPASITEGRAVNPTAVWESELVGIYQVNPDFFSSGQRKSKARLDFCVKSALTHEQIEGWYKLLLRNPNRERVVERYEVDAVQEENETEPVEGTSGRGARIAGRGDSRAYKDKNKARIGNHNRKQGFRDKKIAKSVGLPFS